MTGSVSFLWESLIIQCRAEVRKIYGRMLSRLRRNTDVFQGDLAGLCREDSVLMRGKEFLEVPLSLSAFCAAGSGKPAKTIFVKNRSRFRLSF